MAAMGAWGSTTFENEDAADWLSGFESDGAPAVDSALNAVLELDANDYVQTTEAACALAAAEMVAAAKDGDVSRLPEEYHDAFRDHKDDLDAFGKPAQRALSRILRNSELKDLYEERGELEAWQDDVRELIERLKL